MFFSRTPSASSLSRDSSIRSTGSAPDAAAAAHALAAAAEDSDSPVHVAVGKDFDDGRAVLVWTARNFPRGTRFVLLHVHQPAARIPAGFGMLPANQVEDKILKAYRAGEKKEMNELLAKYLEMCSAALKVEAEAAVLENSNVALGLIDLIAVHRVTKLVMGASSYNAKKNVPKGGRSRTALTVYEKADAFCRIFFINNRELLFTREPGMGVLSVVETPQGTPLNTPGTSMNTPQGVLSAAEASQETPWGTPWHSSSSFPDLSGLSASPLQPQPSRKSVVVDQVASIDKVPSNRVPGTSRVPSSIAPTPAVSFSPPSSSPEEHTKSYLNNLNRAIEEDVFTKLQNALEEAANLKNANFEESRKRSKAEKELLDASIKLSKWEGMMTNYIRDADDKISSMKNETEMVKREHMKTKEELEKSRSQSTALELEISRFQRTVSDYEGKLAEADKLIESLRRDFEELQLGRSEADQEMHRKSDASTLSSDSSGNFTDFTYAELKEATNNFDESLKIGEGGYGKVYRGNLRFTAVAIKLLNPESIQGEDQFNREVEILSRMRHPNLVTLIGACREVKALVYEYLPNGSLEDRLACKNQTQPLSWKARVRIATEICHALIFLHSNKPRSIAHGDLKPGNILLDANYVSKLGDCGICCFLNQSTTTITPYHRTLNPKGTFAYMDPGYLSSGELTAKYDVYSFGVVLLQLLTGKEPFRLQNIVEDALRRECLHEVLDFTAGEWPTQQANQLARLALKCCHIVRSCRPDLATETLVILEDMMNAYPPARNLQDYTDGGKPVPPPYFICPITKEIMRDPVIAADGFTYEAEAIKAWLSRHDMSPSTYVKLPHQELIPNNALRSAIFDWLAKLQ